MTMPLTEPGTAPPTLADDPLWWRSAVIYQVYVRSFADSDGDGTGDLRGVRSRLGYLKDLGVDALWFNPWYPSPLADGGYDVVGLPRHPPHLRHPRGRRAAHQRGARARHPHDHRHRPEPRLERAPLVPGRRSRPGRASPERERFWFHPGKGENGDEMPTTGSRTSRATRGRAPTNPDGTPGEWYLHLFTPEQPDLNWNHPDVRAEHEDILRFWFDRGVAGVRIDSAGLLIKDPTLPEVPERSRAGRAPHRGPRRGARRLPRVAAHRRLVRGHARARRRGLGARRRALRRLPPARRDAHRVQLRLHVAPVGAPRSSAPRST